jgi:hypothetical protein
MKCVLLVCSILSIIAINPNHPKLCINCKHFKKTIWTDNKFANCALFPREDHSKTHLVDGKPDRPKHKYLYCSTARGFDSMCGETGKFYEENEWMLLM